MGKKGRKKKSTSGTTPPVAAFAAAARLPPVDVTSIDNTTCGVCGTHTNPEYWDENKNLVVSCCGRSICRKCYVRQGDEREEITERLQDLALDSIRTKDAPESQLPILFEMFKRSNAPCSMCGMSLPKLEKEHHARIVRLADAGHARSQVPYT